jgi:hypothetical protein
LFYIYATTAAADPSLSSATVNLLINAAKDKYAADLLQANPGWMTVSLSGQAATPSTSRTYLLPSNFGGILEVRVSDSSGYKLEECRPEELNSSTSWPSYAITGSDQAATLTTSTGVAAGQLLYISYRKWPPVLVADGDTPDFLPTQFHDLLAREAAADAPGVSGESEASSRFHTELADRRAQFWFHVGRRSVDGSQTRAAFQQS